jgi:hypothetical protein
MPTAPQIEAMYGDPRLSGIKDHDISDPGKTPWGPQEARVLPPEAPPKNLESRYVFLEDYTRDLEFNIDPMESMEWLNEPGVQGHGYARVGGGLGFGFLSEQPRWRGVLRSGELPPEIMTRRSAYLIVSPRVVKLFESFPVDHLELLEIKWTEDSAPSLHGFVMLDVRRVLQSYDYRQCEVRFHKTSGRMLGLLTSVRGFRSDIPQNVQMFHDLYDRKPFIVSRDLAHFLRDQKVRGLVVSDPASGEDAFYVEDLARELSNG